MERYLWIDASSGVRSGAKTYTGRGGIDGSSRMSGESRSDLILTGTQADCLAVLRNPGHSQSKIAIEAKRSMTQTEVALHRLVELGLARQTASKLWVATPRGETCSFETISDRPYRQTRPPGPGAERLLDLLDRPMHGRAIARELGISREGVRQLLVRLHAQGRVAFGDPDHPSWLVKRTDDESPPSCPVTKNVCCRRSRQGTRRTPRD